MGFLHPSPLISQGMSLTLRKGWRHATEWGHVSEQQLGICYLSIWSGPECSLSEIMKDYSFSAYTGGKAIISKQLLTFSLSWLSLKCHSLCAMNRPCRVTSQLQVQIEHFSREQELSFCLLHSRGAQFGLKRVKLFVSGRTCRHGCVSRCCHFLILCFRKHFSWHTVWAAFRD